MLPEKIFCLGCDIDEEVIETARLLNQHKKNRQFQVCNVERALPANEKFDIIVISEVLEHLNDDEKVLKKTRNLLSNEGILILTVPNYKILINRIVGLFGKPKFQHDSHVREYALNEMKAMLLSCGFLTLSTIGIYLQLPRENQLPKTLRFILSLFVDNLARHLPFFANSILLVAKKC